MVGKHDESFPSAWPITTSYNLFRARKGERKEVVAKKRKEKKLR